MSTVTIIPFSNGTTADADDVNTNFANLKNFVESLSAGSNFDSGAIGTASIANTAVTAAKIATATITSTQMAANSIDTTQITNSAVTLAKLAAAVQALLVPAGTVAATVSASADTGWLLLNGQTVANAQTLYPSLWAVSPAAWKSGSSLVLPNAANRMLEGAGTTTLGATGGSNTVSIAEANLPSHVHTVNPPNTAVSVSVTVNDNTVDRVTRLSSYVPGGSAPGKSTNPLSGLLAGTAGFGLSNTYEDMSVGYETEHAHTASASGSVDIAEFNSGSVGSGTAVTVTNAHLAVNYQIKAH